MKRDRLFLVFDTNIGHPEMARLLQVGYLWCNFSAANRSHAEALWTSEEVRETMALTIATQTQEPTANSLELWIDQASLHFPDIRVFEVIGFPALEISDTIFAEAGFHTISAFIYERLPSVP